MRLTSFTFPRRALGTLLMFGLLPVAAFAAPITLVNASFETLPPGGLTNSCGSGCSYSVAGTPIAGWSTFMVDFGNGNTYAQLQPGSPANPTYFNTAVPDGTTVTSITTLGQSHSGLIQTVVPTVVLGVTYTLQVDLGLLKASLGVGGVGQALLRIGGTGGFTILASGIAPASGQFSTFTASYTGVAADVGKSISVLLESPVAADLQANFDNVRLNDSPGLSATPEPASWGMLGTGLAALLLAARKRIAC